MKNVLIIGAGRSSTALINYLLNEASKYGWFITVADADPDVAAAKINGHPNGRGTWLDVLKPNDRKDLMMRQDVVVSLLPAHLHYRIAKDCIKYKKHLVTASYVSRDLYRLNPEVLDASLIFMGEMGLDPGIDHMSAKKMIDEIRAQGGKITSFRSYAGGLVAPESDDNPWRYKISWNPRNVVLAGQGTSQYLVKGKYKYIPYNRLFKQYRLLNVPGVGEFESYANRDSLLYRGIYGIDDIPTIKRSTLRHPGFCDAWNALVQLGLTSDQYPILESKNMTYRELVDAFLLDNPYVTGTIKERLATFLGIGASSEIIRKLEWLGLFDRKKIGLDNVTPAKILEHLLVDRLKLGKNDKDMIVMHHVFKYKLNRKKYKLQSSMVLKGDDSVQTAMSKLVGLPIGIFVKLILQDKIQETGVQIPVKPSIYNPVLDELKDYGVKFNDILEEI
ncbi:MAG: saccharopine dehydrogenase C-terminal domain-containing protein [Saprospiraceae bacterium]